MINLSFCVPTLRPDNIAELYNSIVMNIPDVTGRNFELILCGPNKPVNQYQIEDKIVDLPPNTTFIQDYGSPVRALSIACEAAQGKYITTIADDAQYLSKSIIRAIIKLEKWEETHGNSYKHVVVGKYVEGNMPWWMMTIETGLLGYSLNTGYAKCSFIPDDWIGFNSFYMHKEYFNELGGFDNQFEVTCVASADLAARAQRDGCTTELMDEPTFVVSHQPNMTGDHGPVHKAQGEHDIPLYSNIYNNDECLNRIKVKEHNWKDAPEKWERRFN